MATQPKLEVDMTGVQSTMLVTLYLKALESRSPHSILGDHKAAEMVERIDWNFDKQIPRGIRRRPYMAALRPKIFDDWSADFLARHPEATVLHLGCGLDSRAQRIDVPETVRWFDVDLPDATELRRQFYTERDGYRMIGASVTDPEWLEEIPPGAPTLIIAEGLLMYLTEADNQQLLRRFTDRFEAGELLFDGLATWEVKWSQRTRKLAAKHGYPVYQTATRDGREVERWNPRLRYVEEMSLVSPSGPLASRRLPLMYRLPPLRDMVRVFRYEF